jgi:hypothetical protein
VQPDDPALGRSLDLDQPAAGGTLDFDLVEIGLGLGQLGLDVLRHGHHFFEIHTNFRVLDQPISSASGKASIAAATTGEFSTASRSACSFAACSSRSVGLRRHLYALELPVGTGEFLERGTQLLDEIERQRPRGGELDLGAREAHRAQIVAHLGGELEAVRFSSR